MMRLTATLVSSLVLSLFLAVGSAESQDLTFWWSFDTQNTNPTFEMNPGASAVAGPGIANEQFAGNSCSGLAGWRHTGWTSSSSINASDYLAFTIDTRGHYGMQLDFQEARTASGPTQFAIYYDIGGGAVMLGEGYSTHDWDSDSACASHAIPFGNAIDNQPQVTIYIYGYASTDASGSDWRVDEVKITAYNGVPIELQSFSVD